MSLDGDTMAKSAQLAMSSSFPAAPLSSVSSPSAAPASSTSWREMVHEMNETVVMDATDIPATEWVVLHHTSLILLTLFGNFLLIFVILKNNQIVRRKRVTPVQMLMLHMCAADILFATVTMIPLLASHLTYPHFYGPDVLCRVIKMLQVMPLYASSFLLVAISADRYQAICRPLASMRSSAYNRPSIYALIAWTTALFFSSPQLILFEKRDGDCLSNYSTPMQYGIYVIVFNTVVWLLPSAIAGFLYYRVCRAVWQSTSFGSSLRMKTQQRGDTNNARLLHSNGLQAHQKGGTLQGIELDRRRVQTVKLTLTIVAANFILWAPFCIISVMDALFPDAIPAMFSTFIMYFGNLNSFMNPWIWFYFNKPQMRRALSCYLCTKPLMSARRITETNTECTYEITNYSDSKCNTSGCCTSLFSIGPFLHFSHPSSSPSILSNQPQTEETEFRKRLPSREKMAPS